VAVDLTCVFDPDFKGFLAGDEDVTDVQLSDAELGLGALALAGEVEGEAVLGAGGVAVGGA
jgi:hypothetical protein